jgi:hypothetical protein
MCTQHLIVRLRGKQRLRNPDHGVRKPPFARRSQRKTRLIAPPLTQSVLSSLRRSYCPRMTPRFAPAWHNSRLLTRGTRFSEWQHRSFICVLKHQSAGRIPGNTRRNNEAVPGDNHTGIASEQLRSRRRRRPSREKSEHRCDRSTFA